VLLRAIWDAWDNAIRLEYEGERLARVIGWPRGTYCWNRRACHWPRGG
jgi:hypothetical protein